MRRNLILSSAVAAVFCLAIVLSAGGAFAALPDTLSLTPREIDINTFFSGKDLKITGEIPASEDVVLEIRGKDSDSSFDMKGRVGPFWMTVGNVELENIPELYLLLLPEGQDWQKKAEALGLGIGSLKDRLVTSGTVEAPPDIFEMFARLKGEEGLYGEVTGAVTYSPSGDDAKTFTAVCRLPDKIQTGVYEIRATTVSHGVVRNRMNDHFTVGEVGLIKLVDHLALDRRVIYGVSAVVLAILAGLLMGVLFKQDGGAH